MAILRRTSGRVLEPIDRVSEVLFGLIMVLTFTGSLSVADAGRDDVRAMLVGALGCNFAWGIIDAVLYLMGADAEKNSAQRLTAGASPSVARVRLTGDDLRGAAGVFLLVFLSTFPVAIPFMVMPSVVPAMRVSNAIAVGLLFLTGYAYGRITSRRPLWTGAAMVVLGGVLVALTIALGG